MPERGGPTAQSGIYYQNSIAALFLGRLCDMQERPPREHVTQVRIEAPEHVDDIVVTYADRHLDYIQAKETISTSGEVWEKLWHDIEEQRWDPKFGYEDRLVLISGADHDKYLGLRELCNRAHGASDYGEWRTALTQSMSSLVHGIRLLLSPAHQDDASVLSLFRRVDVWPLMTLEQIERDEVPRWMPPSNTEPLTLFRLLRDKAGGHARYRKILQAPRLLEELLGDHKITVGEPASFGVHAYREALAQVYGRIEVPGTNMSGSVDRLFLWPALHEVDVSPATPTVSEEDTFYRPEQRGMINLRQFPHATLQHAVIVAGAGFGKTTLLTAITYRLAQGNWLPALIRLSDLLESGQTVIQFLEESVNHEFNVAVRWNYYCDSGRAVMLFDGLDELAPRHRSRVLDLIHKFTGRYQQVPWLLTVRDSAALSQPANAKVLGIEALGYNEVAEFANSYRRAGSTVDVDYLLSQLYKYPDLRRLARIPLFLALLLAIAEPAQALPRKRGDLLERYLYVILHPEEYKPSVHLKCNPYELREAAEHLAFAALEKQETGLAERAVDSVLKTVNKGERTSAYVEDLIVCGLLNRTAHRIRFVFPIVQEYLAAWHLIQYLPEELAPRFELAVRRPWAQALQFALEQHPQADQIVNQLLDKPDDAFGTTLRLVARCITNGAPVSPETHQKVGSRLVELWTVSSWTVQKNAGELLADGFTRPLPMGVRALLEIGWGLQVGGAEIIAACNDADLTRSALTAFLNTDLQYQYYLHDWQTAVDMIADEALSYYLQRAKSEHTTAKEIAALASLIRNLSREQLQPEAYKSVTDDASLPTIIRLAAFFLGPRPIPDSAYQFADELVHSQKPENELRIPEWNLVVEALWSGINPDEHWRSYISDTSLSEEERLDLLFSLLASPLGKEAQLAVLTQLQVDDSISRFKYPLLLLGAYLGDSGAMKEVTDSLDNVSFEDLSVWALVASKHQSGDIVMRGLHTLKDMPLQPDQRASLARDLAVGLTMDVTFDSFGRSWSSQGQILHPAASECAHVVWEWAEEYDGEATGCLMLLASACELGYPGAAESLAEELTYLIQQQADKFDDFGFDNTVSNALYTLGTVGHSLPMETLQRCVEISRSNAAITAVSAIASCVSAEALSWLLQLHRTQTQPVVRDTIARNIEELALRLGVRVVLTNGQLAQEA